MAPGKNIIAPLASGGAELPSAHPDHLVNNTSYFRMSGTSMSAPMVAGVAALILQKSPTLTPDQVKYRLMSTARKLSITGTGSGYVDAYAAVNGTSTTSANTKVVESKLLWQNGTAATWNSASWGSASWGSASWGRQVGARPPGAAITGAISLYKMMEIHMQLLIRLAPGARLRWCAVLLVVILLGLPGAAAPTARPTLLVQPQLLAQAAANPERAVRVIVQQATPEAHLDHVVARLGGTITTRLPMINGFAATLPGQALTRLALAPGLRQVSLDAPVVQSGTPDVSPANLKSVFVKAVNADQVWTQTSGNFQGQGIGIAVVDSGVNPQQDLYTAMGTNRIVAAVQDNSDYNQTVYDNYGHGNHVAGIIAGNGSRSSGQYMGVAPASNIINVKVSNDDGSATASNVVKGLQWVYDNRTRYNIRVVNLSLNNGVAESYQTNPIDAACEILWFNKIVVVVSAGNQGTAGALYPPANDPFVITVGAADDKGTPSISDDTMTTFSAYGTTSDGFAKPDLVAPGKNLVSLMANSNSRLATEHPSNVVNGSYFRMSGTSMAAPVVSGIAALVLQANPTLTPDQVKYRLKATARPFATVDKAGAGYVDALAAVKGTTTQSANTNIPVSKLLLSGSQPLSTSVWTSSTWSTATWSTANWGSSTWSTANWGSDYWGN